MVNIFYTFAAYWFLLLLSGMGDQKGIGWKSRTGPLLWASFYRYRLILLPLSETRTEGVGNGSKSEDLPVLAIVRTSRIKSGICTIYIITVLLKHRKTAIGVWRYGIMWPYDIGDIRLKFEGPEIRILSGVLFFNDKKSHRPAKTCDTATININQ